MTPRETLGCKGSEGGPGSEAHPSLPFSFLLFPQLLMSAYPVPEILLDIMTSVVNKIVIYTYIYIIVVLYIYIILMYLK